MKRRISKLLLLSILFVLVLTACNLPFSIGSPASPEEASPTPTAADENVPVPLEGLAVADLSEISVGTTMVWYDNSVLVFVPGGEFPMGVPIDPADLSQDSNNPLHTVALDPFWIYRFNVTNDMYRLCVAAGACAPPETDPSMPDYLDTKLKDRPVVGVKWEDSQTYCEWMDARLPSEAEWELTARGTEGNSYPWGEDPPACNLLNFEDCSVDDTSDVFAYPEGMSDYEAFDLGGNTFEWVADWYQSDYYPQSPAANPPGPDTGEERSVRGGSFKSVADQLLSAKRFFLDPEKTRNDLGFRCIVTTDTKGFAPFCQLTAYIPFPDPIGLGPPPGSQGTGPEIPPPSCKPRPPTLSSTTWCYDQGAQLGGANVTYTGILSSHTASSCDSGNPMFCTGPDGTSFEVELCTTCVAPPAPPVIVPPVCAPGYTLNIATGICEYAGTPPTPGGGCPPPTFLDPVTGLCKLPPGLLGLQEDCPDGFAFFEPKSCCVAVFTDEIPGDPGIPSASYPGCPIGYGYNPITMSCESLAPSGGLAVKECTTFTVDLATCRDPGDGGDCEPRSCSQGAVWDQDDCCCKAGPNVTGAPTGCLP